MTVLRINLSHFLGTLLLITATVLSTGCSEGTAGSSSKGNVDYTLSGTLEGGTGLIYLAEVQENELVPIDSLELPEDGTFSFTGSIDEPAMHYLMTQQMRSPLEVFIDGGGMTLTANLAEPGETVVTGSALHDTYSGFVGDMASFDQELEQLYPIYQQAATAGDTGLVKQISDQAAAVDVRRFDFVKDYINKNADSQVASFIAVRHFMRAATEEDLESTYNALEAAQPDSRYISKMKEYIDKMKSLQIGSIAPDFTLSTVDGQKVSLSDFRGKVVLIDFWASWCGPCRKENPNVVALYNQYKEKDFEILGVSLDDKQEPWVQAIEQDQLSWQHVSDLQGWGSSAAALYEVRAIPATVLLDKEGRIIDKDLRGEELRDRLSALLNS